MQRQIRVLGYEVEQPPPVVLERRATVTCSRFGLNTPGRRPPLDPADRCRGANFEHTGCLARALAFLDNRDRSRPGIVRVSPCHRATPPLLSEQPESKVIACNCSDSRQGEKALAHVGPWRMALCASFCR